MRGSCQRLCSGSARRTRRWGASWLAPPAVPDPTPPAAGVTPGGSPRPPLPRRGGRGQGKSRRAGQLSPGARRGGRRSWRRRRGRTGQSEAAPLRCLGPGPRRGAAVPGGGSAPCLPPTGSQHPTEVVPHSPSTPNIPLPWLSPPPSQSPAPPYRKHLLDTPYCPTPPQNPKHLLDPLTHHQPLPAPQHPKPSLHLAISCYSPMVPQTPKYLLELQLPPLPCPTVPQPHKHPKHPRPPLPPLTALRPRVPRTGAGVTP